MGTLKVIGFLSVCFFSAVICTDVDFGGSLGSLGLKGSALVFCRSECKNKLGYVFDDKKTKEVTKIVYVATSKSHSSCVCDLQGREELKQKGYSPRGPSCQTKVTRDQCSCEVSPTLGRLLRQILGDSSNMRCKLTNDCVCTVSAPFQRILRRKGIDFEDYSSRFRKSPTEANKWLEDQGIKVMDAHFNNATPSNGSNSPKQPLSPYSPNTPNPNSPNPLNPYSPNPLNPYSPNPLNPYSPNSPNPPNPYSPNPLPSLPAPDDDPVDTAPESLGLLKVPIPGSMKAVRCRAECIKKHGYFIMPVLQAPTAVATSSKHTSCKCELSQVFLDEVKRKRQQSILEDAGCVLKVRDNECRCSPTHGFDHLFTIGEYDNAACKLKNDYCDCEISTNFGNYLKKQGVNPKDYASRYLKCPKSANNWLATQGIQVGPYQ